MTSLSTSDMDRARGCYGSATQSLSYADTYPAGHVGQDWQKKRLDNGGVWHPSMDPVQIRRANDAIMKRR